MLITNSVLQPDTDDLSCYAMRKLSLASSPVPLAQLRFMDFHQITLGSHVKSAGLRPPSAETTAGTTSASGLDASGPLHHDTSHSAALCTLQ
jgi:hypothetical protein